MARFDRISQLNCVQILPFEYLNLLRILETAEKEYYYCGAVTKSTEYIIIAYLLIIVNNY